MWSSNFITITGNQIVIKEISEVLEDRTFEETGCSDIVDFQVLDKEIKLVFGTDGYAPTDFCRQLSEDFKVEVEIEYIEADLYFIGRDLYRDGETIDSCHADEPRSQKELDRLGFSHIDFNDYARDCDEDDED